MFSAWIRNQWHRQMGFITTSIYSWSKGTEGNSLEEQSFLPALFCVVVVFPLMWSETTGESFCSQWPFPIFSNRIKLQALLVVLFQAPILSHGKGKSPHLFYVSSQQRHVGIFCPAPITSIPLQGHHQSQTSVRVTAGSHPGSLQRVLFLAKSLQST